MDFTKIIKSFKNNWLIVVSILLFSFVYVLRIFHKDYLLFGEEQGFINYDFVNYRFSTIWKSTQNFGNAAILDYFTTITIGNFWKIAYFLGLNNIYTERLFLFLAISLTIFFSFLSFLELSKNKFLSLILAFCYVTTFNYISVFTSSPKIFQYLIMPISLFFWLKWSHTNKKIYILTNTLITSILFSIAINPPQMAGAYAFIIFYVFVSVLLDKSLFKKSVFFLFPYFLNLLIVFSWSFIALRYSGNLYHFNLFDVHWESTAAPLQDVLRFFGGWWDYSGSSGLPYNHLDYYYHSFAGILLTYIPMFLLIVLFMKNTNRILRIKLIALLVFFILLTKGTTPPFSFIFNILYKIGFFKIFREPWAKFILDFIFLVFLSIAALFQNISGRKEAYVKILLLAFLIFQIIPIAMGLAVDHRNIYWRIIDTQIPSYWQNIQKWSKQNAQDKRMLVLPFNKKPGSETTLSLWKPYFFWGKPEVYLLYSDIIYDQPQDLEDKKIISSLASNMNSNLFTINSIDYVLDKKDTSINPSEYLTFGDFSDYVDSGKRINFGNLDVYPVKENFKTDKVRTINELRYSDKNNCYGQFSTNLPNISRLAFINSESQRLPTVGEASITINKINTTSYEIKFNNKINTNVAILLNETYNKGWGIYKDNNLISKEIVDSKNHYIANCFSNLWIIPSGIASSNNKIILRYQPEYIFSMVKILFFSTLTVFLFVVLIWKNKKKGINSFDIFSNYYFKVENEISFFCKSKPLTIVYRILVKIRILILLIGIRILYEDLLSPRIISKHSLFTILIVFLVINILFRFGNSINLFIVLILLLFTAYFRVYFDPYSSEKFAYWLLSFLILNLIWEIILYLFIKRSNGLREILLLIYNDISDLYRLVVSYILVPLYRLVVSYILVPLYSYIKSSNNHLVGKINTLMIAIYLRGKYEIKLINKIRREKFSFSAFLILFIKGCIIIFILSIIVSTYNKFDKAHKRELINPEISKIEPTLAYHSTKLVIYGKRFGWNKGEKMRVIDTRHKELNVELWTDTKIILTVPLDWKPGIYTIWIEGPELWDGKIILTQSNTVSVRVIPISSSFMKDDDEFFEQLKHVAPEVRQINGYEIKP